MFHRSLVRDDGHFYPSIVAEHGNLARHRANGNAEESLRDRLARAQLVGAPGPMHKVVREGESLREVVQDHESEEAREPHNYLVHVSCAEWCQRCRYLA